MIRTQQLNLKLQYNMSDEEDLEWREDLLDDISYYYERERDKHMYLLGKTPLNKIHKIIVESLLKELNVDFNDHQYDLTQEEVEAALYSHYNEID